MEQHHNLHQMAVAPNITSTALGHIPQSTPCVNCHLQCSSNVNLLTGKQLKLAQTKIQYNYIYKGVKMFSTKTSTDVGMVPLIKQLHGKPTGGKSVGTRRGMP